MYAEITAFEINFRGAFGQRIGDNFDLGTKIERVDIPTKKEKHSERKKKQTPKISFSNSEESSTMEPPPQARFGKAQSEMVGFYSYTLVETSEKVSS